MLPPCATELQQSLRAGDTTGSWQLAPGRALSLCPRSDGVLRISRGRAWATLDVPPHGHRNETGDHCLQAGEQLSVCAGRHLVLESLDSEPVDFEWLHAPALVPLRLSHWNEAVLAPLADLGRAAQLALKSVLRLLRGLLSPVCALLSGRAALRP